MNRWFIRALALALLLSLTISAVASANEAQPECGCTACPGQPKVQSYRIMGKQAREWSDKALGDPISATMRRDDLGVTIDYDQPNEPFVAGVIVDDVSKVIVAVSYNTSEPEMVVDIAYVYQGDSVYAGGVLRNVDTGEALLAFSSRGDLVSREEVMVEGLDDGEVCPVCHFICMSICSGVGCAMGCNAICIALGIPSGSFGYWCCIGPCATICSMGCNLGCEAICSCSGSECYGDCQCLCGCDEYGTCLNCD